MSRVHPFDGAFIYRGFLLAAFLVLSVHLVVCRASLKRQSHEFDFLVYTQSWPPAACLNAEAAGHHCIIPKNVTSWTIHGLWPSKLKSFGPQFCNHSWHFDASKISSLYQELETKWPNIYAGYPVTSLWKHEWEKHGTCAASQPYLRGEFNYFYASLKLQKTFDLEALLAKAGIFPKNILGYTSANLTSALKKVLRGKKPVIQCFFDHTKTQHQPRNSHHKNYVQYLFQIEVCLNKTDLEVIDCTHGGNCNSSPIYYPKFPREKTFVSL